MKRTTFFLVAMVVVTGLAVQGSALLPVAQAGPGPMIGNQNVSGSYTFEFEGRDPVIPPNSTQAGVGLANFDGRGNITGSFTVVHRQTPPLCGPTDTTIETGTFTGTYDVNPDGTATVNFTETVTLTPCGVTVTNAVTLAAGFSGKFQRFKFVQTGDSSDPTGNDLPEVISIGRGEKL